MFLCFQKSLFIAAKTSAIDDTDAAAAATADIDTAATITDTDTAAAIANTAGAAGAADAAAGANAI